MNNYQQIKEKFQELKTDRDYLLSIQQREETKLAEFEQYSKDAQEARIIIQAVAKNTQKKLEDKFNNLVTMALQAVFPEDLKFQVDIVSRRNKTEADVWIIKEGNKQDIWSGGGGPLDVIALACRISFWSLKKDKRPLFLLDEPFKYLHSPQYQKNCSEMLKTLFNKLGIQFIIVSDQESLTGDKEYGIVNGEVFEVFLSEELCGECEFGKLFSYYKSGEQKFSRCKNCGEVR